MKVLVLKDERHNVHIPQGRYIPYGPPKIEWVDISRIYATVKLARLALKKEIFKVKYEKYIIEGRTIRIYDFRTDKSQNPAYFL